VNLRSDGQAQQNSGIAALVQAEGRPCVVLVRHGQTAWNAEGRLQGQKDVDLNGCGLQQARSIAQLLQRIPLAQIHCSDLKRCVDTAREIATCNVGSPRLLSTPLLREMALGILEGELKDSQTTESASRYYRKLCLDEINCRVPGGGESLKDVHRREATFFANTSDTLDAEANHVIVSHRNVNKMALKYLLGLSYEEGFRVEQENQRLYLFFPRSTRLWSCWVEQETCHLQPGLAFSTEVYG
jgi:broad specificity phosphatase PhoE